MKKTLITVLAAAAVLYGTCGTVFSVELNLKKLKDAVKKDFEQKREAQKGGSEQESSEKQEAADTTAASTTSGTSNSSATGSKTAADTVNTEPNSEDDFDFTVNDDFTEITITKYKGTRKDVVIPASIQDVPVVYIGESAFSDRYDEKRITSVVIPEGVKGIGDGAFSSCHFLQSLTLPSGIHIGNFSFDGCHDLESIDIPKGCTLGESAFKYCAGLKSVTLPEGLKVIPNSCFDGCSKLATVNFPASLTYIGSGAFTGCPIASVELPEGLEYLGLTAFNSDAITSVSIPKSLKWIETAILKKDYTPRPCISGDNIATIKIAEGSTAKVIWRGLDRPEEEENIDIPDARKLITGAAISKSIKLQKSLAAFKITFVKVHRSWDVFSADGNALLADLQRYFDISKDDKKAVEDLKKQYQSLEYF